MKICEKLIAISVRNNKIRKLESEMDNKMRQVESEIFNK